MMTVFGYIGMFVTGGFATVALGALWAARRDRKRRLRARGASPTAPVVVLPEVHGEGASISDVVDYFENSR